MATVTDFSEAELWYIYEALTTQTFAGATQQEIWEIFNGTNPQGFASSLFDTVNQTSLADLTRQTALNTALNNFNGFSIADQLSETISGADITIANLLVETLSGSDLRIANVAYNSYTKLNSIDNKVSTSANQTTANNSLSSIDTKLSSQATATNQTTANNYLNLIDAQTADIASYTQTTNTYLSALRTPVIISTSASATISGQLHNISIYNSGSATGTITVGATTINLPAGVTVNYDAGGNNNRFATNTFGYNATGTTFIISYVN